MDSDLFQGEMVTKTAIATEVVPCRSRLGERAYVIPTLAKNSIVYHGAIKRKAQAPIGGSWGSRLLSWAEADCAAAPTDVSRCAARKGLDGGNNIPLGDVARTPIREAGVALSLAGVVPTPSAAAYYTTALTFCALL